MRIGNWSVPNSEQQTAKTNAAETEVAESSGESEEAGEITLQQRPANAKTERTVNIDEIIKAFQLPDTSATRGLIAEMARGGIELSAENIDILSKASEAFPEQKPEQIVFMAREGITINTPNVERFQQFLEHKNLVGEQLSNILRQLPAELSEKSTVDVQETPSPPFSEKSAEVLDDDTPRASRTETAQTTITDDALSLSNPEHPEKAAVQNPEQATTLETTEKQLHRVPEKLVSYLETPEKLPAQNPENVTVETSEKSPAHAVEKQQTALEIPEELPTQNPEKAATLETPEKQPTQNPEKAATPEIAEKQPAQTSEKAAVNLETSEKQTIQTHEKQASEIHTKQAEIIEAIKSKEALPNEEPATIEQKIASLFKKVDSKNPHKLPRELNARELVRELAEVIETVKEKLPELEPSRREALSKAVAELEQSVKFMDNLNKYTPIVNIPLQWGNERTTAELYVFNDSKRGRKIDPQNATMFVSLMTANAGRVETMIKVLGKNVECDFSLELPEIVNTVRGEMHTLYNLLDAQGFKLARTTAQTAEKTADIFDVSKVREQNKNRYFFDRKV